MQEKVELLEKSKGSKVLVVGSGPAGVELATTMADRLKGSASVELVSTGDPHIRPREHKLRPDCPRTCLTCILT